MRFALIRAIASACALSVTVSPALALDVGKAPFPKEDRRGTDGLKIQDLDGSLVTQIGDEASALSDVAVDHGGPSGGFKTRQWGRRTSPAGPRSFAYSGDHSYLDAQGAGVNGPDRADYGRSLSVIKRGFPSPSSRIGELDGLLVYMRQSGPNPTSAATSSDLNGIQLNVQHSGDPGFLSGIEGRTSRIDAKTAVETLAMSYQIGAIDPYGKNQERNLDRFAGGNRLSFGYFAAMLKGNGDRAFFSTSSLTGPCWEDYAYFGQSGAPSFRVKATCSGSAKDGQIVLGPDTGSVTLGKDASNRLTVQSTGGSALPVQTVPGAWTAYTPSLTTDGGAPSAGTTMGRYEIVGKKITLRAMATISGMGPASGSVKIGLPPGVALAPDIICSGSGRENGARGRALQVFAYPGSVTVTVLNLDGTSPVSAGMSAHVTLACEIR